ncbi:MAG: ATP-binding cassette domain-containing protein [Bacteroidetes bacterium]|nr:ATP-binding cassette domain-containing protein [Bacteroidota bacterium]
MIMTEEEPRIQTESDLAPADVVVEMHHIHKAFDGHVVLKDINLSLRKGENLVIIGKSGTGKSVLIKCIIGLIDSDEGTLTILGEDISTLKEKPLAELRKKIGFLFQSGALYDSMTVRQNLEFPLLRQSTVPTRKEVDVLVAEALQNVGLSDAIEKSTTELSGGMRKRLGLARTLILKPEIMLYDEPTTGLDAITSREISKLIIEVQKKQKTSSIIITHDIECARLTADRVIVLNEGVCVAEGSFEELKHSGDEWVRSFFE